jgi:hypothetical protein
MKEAFKIYLPFTIALLAFMFYLHKCKPVYNTSNSTTHKDSVIVFIMDTSTHRHYTTNIYSNPIFTVSPSIKVDTKAIIKSYFTKYFLSDTLKDTLINLVVNDTLFNNRITSRYYQYKLVKPYQIVKTVTETKTFNKTNGLFLGLYGEAGKQIYGAGPYANFIFKNNNIGIGFNLLNRSALIQYSRKINTK